MVGPVQPGAHPPGTWYEPTVRRRGQCRDGDRSLGPWHNRAATSTRCGPGSACPTAATPWWNWRCWCSSRPGPRRRPGSLAQRCAAGPRANSCSSSANRSSVIGQLGQLRWARGGQGGSPVLGSGPALTPAPASRASLPEIQAAATAPPTAHSPAVPSRSPRSSHPARTARRPRTESVHESAAVRRSARRPVRSAYHRPTAGITTRHRPRQHFEQVSNPVYGSVGWLAVVDPGPPTDAAVRELLRDAHRLARSRYER